jgi:hypothetical protein
MFNVPFTAHHYWLLMALLDVSANDIDRAAGLVLADKQEEMHSLAIKPLTQSWNEHFLWQTRVLGRGTQQ